MGVNLTKGQRVNLEKSLTLALIGLGWDVKRFDGGADFDLDASAFLLGSDGKASREEDFIFYSNLKSRNGAVIHTGDNRTGAGDGDDEKIIINFTKVPAEVSKIAITVTIYDAEARRQNFGQVSNAYVRVAKIADEKDLSGEEVLRFDLGEDFSTETALVVCEIYRHGDDWKFNAVGSGYSGGLAALCRSFGIDAA
ncbi:MAG: TerD family protein [Spirochaetaceae bacterium]|jgi:tellurium resistance protein TerD|nr:TerD family protein [Spirochaetaceae bacterium]